SSFGAHQLLNSGQQKRKKQCRAQQSKRDPTIQIPQTRWIVSDEESGKVTCQLVSKRGRQKPRAHHESNKSHRSKSCHHTQPHWTQTQLTTDFEEVESYEPPETHPPLSSQHRGRNHQQICRSDQQQTQCKLRRTRWLSIFQSRPQRCK